LPFQNGNICRSVPASIRAFDGEVKAVKIGLSKPPLFDLQQLYRFKFLKIRADTALCGSHVLSEPDLAGKAGVVVPRVFEKHRVGELRANRNIFFGEKEIRNLGKAVTGSEIGTHYFNVSFFENVADVALGAIGHTMTLYAARNAQSPAYPRFLDAFRVISSRSKLLLLSACKTRPGAACRDVSGPAAVGGGNA
jgi:hypothetical protein